MANVKQESSSNGGGMFRNCDRMLHPCGLDNLEFYHGQRLQF